jgi:hypothetical protein
MTTWKIKLCVATVALQIGSQGIFKFVSNSLETEGQESYGAPATPEHKIYVNL